MVNVTTLQGKDNKNRIADELESSQVTAIFDDLGENPLDLASIQRLEMALMDEDTQQTINGHTATNILNTGNGAVDSSGKLTLLLDPADNPIIDREKPVEFHLLTLSWEYTHTSGAQVEADAVFRLQVAPQLTAVTPIDYSGPVLENFYLESPLKIGDDFTKALGREFQWQHLTSLYASPPTTTFRGWKHDCCDATPAWEVTTTASVDPDNTGYLLTFELPSTTSQDIPAGEYDWEVTLTFSDETKTIYGSHLAGTVDWVC